RDQMLRLGRFLWGAWLRTAELEPLAIEKDGPVARATYRDWKGARHSRRVRLNARGLMVEDNIDEFVEQAVLRCRLKPGAWQIEGREDGIQQLVVVSDGSYTLEVRADMPIVRSELVQGWESRYYLQKTPLPILLLVVNSPGSLVTKVIRHQESRRC